MARMMWLIGLLSLGVFSKAQSIGGPLGQATGRRRGVRLRYRLPRPIDRRRAAANVELSVVIPSKDAGKQITDLLESLTNVPLATEIIGANRKAPWPATCCASGACRCGDWRSTTSKRNTETSRAARRPTSKIAPRPRHR